MSCGAPASPLAQADDRRSRPPVRAPFALEPEALDLSRLAFDRPNRLPSMPESPAGEPPTFLWQVIFRARLAARLGCDAEDLEAARAEAARDYRSYVRSLFRDAGLSQIVMDMAWPAGAAERLAEYEDVSGCRVHPLFRVDMIVDQALQEAVSFDELLRRFDGALEGARVAGYRGLKSAIAYRTGLAVDPQATETAARDTFPGDGPMQRRAKPLRDFLLRRTLAFAAESGLPLQVHTGFGDGDLSLAEANPLLLDPLLRTPEAKAVQIVLLHAAYPYHEEAAYLAAAHPSVHADFSLVNIFTPALLADRLIRLVELAPIDKLLVGTDGHVFPETYWFAATLARDAWGAARGRLAEIGAPRPWLDRATRALFEDNARRLYRLD
jgi:hypothetical protein